MTIGSRPASFFHCGALRYFTRCELIQSFVTGCFRQLVPFNRISRPAPPDLREARLRAQQGEREQTIAACRRRQSSGKVRRKCGTRGKKSISDPRQHHPFYLSATWPRPIHHIKHGPWKNPSFSFSSPLKGVQVGIAWRSGAAQLVSAVSLRHRALMGSPLRGREKRGSGMYLHTTCSSDPPWSSSGSIGSGA